MDLNAWCLRHLDSGVAEVRFETGHLSQVRGVRLTDGRDVVVKSRPGSPRLIACSEVQRALWQAGFPAPEPLVGPIVDGDLAVSAEAFVGGGSLAPLDLGAAAPRFAELLARFIALAPAADSIGSLKPQLPWVAWDHPGAELWPAPDDRDVNLNTTRGTPWLDHVGKRVRERLARFTAPGIVIGHGDWEAQNLRWHGDQPLVVHDWDSVISGPEVTIVGQAASVWPCGVDPRAASVAESAAFIDAYQVAAGRRWSAEETEASWAAGLWVSAFNTKKSSLDNVPWLTPREAEERLRLAAA